MSAKFKLLYLMEILNDTDEDNIITMKEILYKLSQKGIKAERKSVSSDIKTLIDFGMDINLYEENRKGYFLRNRDFDLHEIKLLVDAVLSAKFITINKSDDLIKKLKKLLSLNQSKTIEKQLYIFGRNKYDNEQIYYNIDTINKAILNNKKISFKYFSYNINKERVFHREGNEYIVNPYSLTWFEDNYYLIGNYDKYDDLSHYRIDRILTVEILQEPRKDYKSIRTACDYNTGFNIADYTNKSFNMFAGEKETVEVKFKNYLLNVVLDKLGLQANVYKVDEHWFKIRAEVLISSGFVYWVLQFGRDAEILYPESLRQRIKDEIVQMNNLYP